MWPFKKEKLPPSAEIQQPPPPTTYEAIMRIALINNMTDKEYVIESKNDFGLTLTYIDDSKKLRPDLLAIQQRLNINGDRWEAKGRFYNFSVISIIKEEFDIPVETEPTKSDS